jgi:hypothetical protein
MRMARLTVPKVPVFVQELCRRGKVRLRKFKTAGEFEREVSKFKFLKHSRRCPQLV